MTYQMYILVGVLNCLLVLIVLRRTMLEKDQFMDCRLFGRLLIAVLLVDISDIAGWLLDGRLTGILSIITSITDALNLILTAAVCWCWVQYVQYLAYEDSGMPGRKNYFSTIIFSVQAISVLVTIPTKMFYYIDANGFYYRSTGYEIFTILCLVQLIYTIALSFSTCHKVDSAEKRHELQLVGLIILLPVCGTIVQGFFYGISMIWTCMTVLVILVYIHIQDKRRARENAEQREQLRAALQQAQDASKAKTEFLSNMSHDIRTPMNAIVGFTAIAERHIDDKEIVHNSLTKITTSSNHLLNLINDILDMRRIESGKIELQVVPCNLATLIHALVDMIQSQISENQLELFVDTFHVRNEEILADPVKLNQILINLIGNAIKFNKPGGAVSVRIEQNESTTDGMGNYIFTVKDTGRGIAPEYINRIFEPFERCVHDIPEDRVEGTGIGLAIVRKIVNTMGGTISVTSEPGKGTEFKVELCFGLQTLAEPSGMAHSEPKIEKPQYCEDEFRGKRILLAEDHPLNREIAVRLLSDKGFRVEEAEDGIVAVEKFKLSRERFYDFILMDIRMPRMDGYQATEQIRALERKDAKTVPIIAMTANAFDEDKKRALEYGMNAHLSKPINVEQLFGTLENKLPKN